MAWWECVVSLLEAPSEEAIAPLQHAGLMPVVEHDHDGWRVRCYTQAKDEPACCEPLASLGRMGPSVLTWECLDQAALQCGASPCIQLASGVYALSPDTSLPADAHTSIRVLAGCAFGDGAHPTTAMLAERLVDGGVKGARLADVGCGSGLLGLLGLCLGAESCTFTDIDADSCESVELGIAMNGFAPQPVLQGNLLDPLPAGACFDLVIANLYAELLLDVLADRRLPTVMSPGGRLLLSGVSSAKREVMIQALGPSPFQLLEQYERDGWCAFVLQA